MTWAPFVSLILTPRKVATHNAHELKCHVLIYFGAGP